MEFMMQHAGTILSILSMGCGVVWAILKFAHTIKSTVDVLSSQMKALTQALNGLGETMKEQLGEERQARERGDIELHRRIDDALLRKKE
jgi:hypothetical protein